MSEWRAFRRALPRRERPAFDEMLNTARLYTSASSAALRTSRFEGMAMAIIFHHYRLVTACIEGLSDSTTSQQQRHKGNPAPNHT